MSGDHNSLPLRWFPLEKANHERVVKLTNCENLAQLVMGYGRRAPRRAVGRDVPRVLFGWLRVSLYPFAPSSDRPCRASSSCPWSPDPCPRYPGGWSVGLVRVPLLLY